jgi:hypothetical protein
MAGVRNDVPKSAAAHSMVEACLFQIRVKPEVLEVCMESLLNFAGDLAVRDVCGNDIPIS